MNQAYEIQMKCDKLMSLQILLNKQKNRNKNDVEEIPKKIFLL